MKKSILFLFFFFSLTFMYAQSVKIIHLKSGLDARGTITESNDSIVRLQTESGKTVSIYTIDIESMEEEKSAFDPKVLVGKWACYKSSGERSSNYDLEIRENNGFYTITYKYMFKYESNTINSHAIGGGTPSGVTTKNCDLDIDQNGEFSIDINQQIIGFAYVNNKRKMHQDYVDSDELNISLKYINGELKGSINIYYCFAAGNPFTEYFTVQQAYDAGYALVFHEGPGDKFNVYYKKQ